MYQYDEIDRQFIRERVAQYRDQTNRYLAGEISDDVFQQLRLRNGLYIQRLAPMLRLAIPYGTLSSVQMRAIAQVSREYDKGYGHLSTRQNIQLNWPELADVPDILDDLSKVNLHAIQTSGSCIRNVTTDQFAGVSADEIIDARPYCEIIRQWSTYHPEFEWLPRKFKIALNGAVTDRAAIAVHDIGIQVRRYGEHEARFDFYVGGGLGRTPAIGSLIRENLEERHLLTYLEAILRVYNRYGRRDNKYKARIKILVRALGADRFKELVDEEWEHLKDSPQELTGKELDRIRAHFEPYDYGELPDLTRLLAEQRLQDPEFNRWMTTNVTPHKRSGYAAVTLSTKAPGIAPGDVTDEQMDAIADWSEEFGFGEIRISHEQNLVLPDVEQQHLYTLFVQANEIGLGSSNIGHLTDMICCPGGDYCSLANAKSIPVAEEIQRHFDDTDYMYDLGPIDVNISGCMNACGHHHVGHIGILGVDKKGQEFYQISLGGNAGNHASLGKIIGPSFSRHEVLGVFRSILDVFVSLRLEDESFLECYRRVGIQPFKARVYESTSDSKVNADVS